MFEIMWEKLKNFLVEVEKDDEEEFEYRTYMESKEILAKEDAKYDFPISRSQALEIANRNENLKSDFCRNTKLKSITWLSFQDKEINVIEKDNKKYWQIQITEAEVSGCEIRRTYEYNWDGVCGKKDLKLLRCLIDVQTGEYIYYPSKSRLKIRNSS